MANITYYVCKQGISNNCMLKISKKKGRPLMIDHFLKAQ